MGQSALMHAAGETQASPELAAPAREVVGVGEFSCRYRLDILAMNTAEVVSAAGGLICDRALMGWDVRVFTVATDDRQPLQILGADAFALDQATAISAIQTSNSALIVSAELATTDVSVRHRFNAALLGRGEVKLWGSTAVGVGPKLKLLQYRVSTAGLAFKGQALQAAALPHNDLATTEKFRSRSMSNP